MQKQTRHVGKPKEGFAENTENRWNENEKKKEQMKLLPSETGGKVQFELSAEPGSQVFVAGTFNNWNPTANPLKDNSGSGHFKASLHVPRGTHEYKFVVNGIWSMDPNCAEEATNAVGSRNSVFHV